MTEPLPVADPAPAPASAPASRKRIVLGIVGLVLVVAVAWGLHWWTHPTLLSENSLGLGSGTAAPQPVATATLHVGVASPLWPPAAEQTSKETVTITSARAHFTENSSGTSAAFVVCTVADDDTVISSAIDLEGACTQVRPVEDGTRLRWGSGEYLVMTLRSTRPGKAHVNWVDVDYSRSGAHLFQHGTDRVRGGITVRVTD